MSQHRASHLLSLCMQVTLLFTASMVLGLHGFAQTWNLQAPSSTCAGLSQVELASAVQVYGGLGAGIAYDPVSGAVYFAENYPTSGSPFVGIFVPLSTATPLPSPTFGQVTALGFYQDSLYVADGTGGADIGHTGLNVVWQRAPVGTWTQLITNVNNPTGLAFSNSNIYVASYGDGAVYAYNSLGQLLGTVWTAPDSTAAPFGLAVDQNGNLFIAGNGQSATGGRIFKVAAADVAGFTGNYSVFFDPATADPTGIYFNDPVGVDPYSPDALAFDAYGYLYVSYYNSRKMVRIAPNGSSVVVFPGAGTYDDSGNGLAITPQGDLITLFNSGALIQIHGMSPSINPAADFSTTVNGGIWSYGYTTSSGAVFNPLTSNPNVSATDYVTGSAAAYGLDFWSPNPPLDPSNLDPDIVHNEQASTLTPFCCALLPPGELGLQPGPVGSGYAADLRWTVPFAGTYLEFGTWSGLDYSGPTNTQGQLIYNSGTLQWATPVASFGASNGTTFSPLITAAQCDTLDFNVSAGSNNAITGLDAVIVPAADSMPLSFSGNSVWFQTQPVGVLSSPVLTTVTNSSSDTVSILQIQIANNVDNGLFDFTVSGSCSGNSVASGSTCSIGTTFRPASLGARTAFLQVTSADSVTGQVTTEMVPLVGIGVPNTTISLTTSSNPVSSGTPLNLTATVTVTGGVGVPVGSVQFYDGANPLGSPVAVTSGGAASSPAVLSGVVLSEGDHSISAVFTPTGAGLVGITSAAVQETVTTPEPITTFTGAPSSAGYQSMFQVTATTNASTIPTITGTTGVCSVGPVSGTAAIASAMVTMLTGTGSCVLTAGWAADSTYTAATASQTTIAATIAPTVNLEASSSATYQSTFPVTATTNASTVPTIIGTKGVCSVGPVTGTAAIASATVTMLTGTGSCVLTAVWVADNNYSVATVSQSTTAVKIGPTVTFNGAPASASFLATFAVSTSTNASTTASIVTSGSCTNSGAVVTITAPSGTCTMIATWAADNNYLDTFTEQLTIATKATPTITWATPAAIAYGTALSGAQLNATVTYNGAAVAGKLVYSPAKGTVLSAGPQPLSVTFTPTNTTDYTAATATVTLQVNLAAPRITWPNPAAITYGTALSSTQLNAIASVPGSFLYSPASGAVLDAGTQSLSVTFTPTDTIDYAPVTATASLRVNKASTAVTWGNPAAITYGTPLSSTQLNATASVPGTFTYSPESGTVLSGGSHKLSVTFTPTDATDYATSSASATIQVSQATPTINWATPAAITYGTKLSGTQLNATATYNGATVNGTFTYTPGTGTVLGVGAQTLSVTFTPSNTANFTGASGSVLLQVNPAGTKVKLISSKNPSVLGQSVTFTATVTLAAPNSSGSPTSGSVKLTIGNALLGTASLNGSSIIRISTTSLPRGMSTVIATYVDTSDANYVSSSGSLVQTVN